MDVSRSKVMHSRKVLRAQATTAGIAVIAGTELLPLRVVH